MSAISHDIKARFKAAISRLLPDGEGLALAVSGGPDSVALLVLAHDLLGNSSIAAVTVDHGLRPAATDEANYVASLCKEMGVTHAILRPDVVITGNVQSSARKARYELLQKWSKDNGYGWIATAHHSDDQMETFLMRLARGSGIDGLSSIREVNGNIIRPLLHMGKADLVDVCQQASIQFIEDPSNQDTQFDRVAMRNWLSDNRLPFDHDNILRSTAALAQGSDALIWMAKELFVQRVEIKGEELFFDHKNLPIEMKRRIILLCIGHIDEALSVRGDALSNSMKSLGNNENSMLGNILIRPGDRWHFAKAPPRRLD